MVKRSVPKQFPPLTAEGRPGPNQNFTVEDRVRTEKVRGKRRTPRGKPSKPQPLSTDVSEFFKDK